MQNDQFLNCPICLDFAKLAVESTCCHNIFCQECSMSISTKSCPVCCSPSFKCLPSILARRMVASLPITCEECNITTTMGDYANHIELCPRKMRGCGIGNCEFIGNSAEFFKHLEENHKREVFKAFDKEAKKKESLVEKPVNKGDYNAIRGNADPIATVANASGRRARLGENGKYYCRARQAVECRCCDGYCGPTNGCNCKECMMLDIKARGLGEGYFVNSAGAICRKGSTGLFYCGRYTMMPGTDGYCGPTNGPNCQFCKQIDGQVKNRYAGIN